MKVLYTAEATVTGGRDQGHGRTSDGALDVQLRSPKELGGEGGGQALADELDVPLIGKVPLTMPLREQADNGLPLVLNDPDDPAAQAVAHAARGLVAMFPVELPILQMATVGGGASEPGPAKPAGMTLPMAG